MNSVRRRTYRLLALLGAGIGSLGIVALVLLFHSLGIPKEQAVFRPGVLPWDLALLLLLGVQHSGMARPSFKRRLIRLVPQALERSVYVSASGVVCGTLALCWVPLGGESLWRGPWWLSLVQLAAAVGLVGLSVYVDPLTLFGLRQAWDPDRPAVRDELRFVGPYRLVRHPQMTCVLVGLWAAPVMTSDLLLLSGGLTMYVIAGTWFEERDLLRRFGAPYAWYRGRVPALLPWRSPVAPSVYPEIEPPC